MMLGDSGQITAAVANAPRFGGHVVPREHLITLGRIETIAPDVGGVDTITTGTGGSYVDKYVGCCAEPLQRQRPRPTGGPRQKGWTAS